ncbi:MAG TPA: histidinol dehydrogenase [Flavilitoribacter sp.]|nr:histidinol dehydrogenase [Flavilitoribacter sp.]HMQ90700.1 histidinol dehydrogenase [Flavilitoribacter sp.]
MELFLYPDGQNWSRILQRPALETNRLEAAVESVLNAVKTEGDVAIRRFTRQFDGADLPEFAVSPAEMEQAVAEISPGLQAAIRIALRNIESFHAQQKEEVRIVETMPGVQCWRKSVGIERVGLYIPGGTAPLFSTVLMLGIPARLAGCKEIILCTPPGKDGKIHPAILFSARLAGITRVFKIGGAQAIAAMAYGTENVPRVDKIFGPGNQYVTAAKQMVGRQGTAIDMPAGPSEVLVFAGEDADPDFVAADLLSQAEHGVDSQVVLVTLSEQMARRTREAVDRQLAILPRKTIAEGALAQSAAVVLNTEAEAVELINQYAPEHLILACENAGELAGKVVNAGSVFLGHYSPESVGDYASGTNHTLPTNGYARAYSGVSLDSFVKKITFQALTPEGLANIGPAVMEMAGAEALDAHKRAVGIRLEKIPAKAGSIAGVRDILPLVRPNIRNLSPYSSARSEFSGQASVFLDANENPFGNGLNRYPDPLQWKLKSAVSAIKGVPVQNIFLGNGSDEAIDLLIRIFCEPGRDSIMITPPTYGMYRVSADIADVGVVEVPLLPGFQPDVQAILDAADNRTKLLFLCSPNNPTGNALDEKAVLGLIRDFPGIVVIDEAYIDFSAHPGYAKKIDEFPNLVVLQTLSKAWGLAAIRLGMAFTGEPIIGLLNKVKPPYNINELTQNAALEALSWPESMRQQLKIILGERKSLEESLAALPAVQKVYPSDANFLLVKLADPVAMYRHLAGEGIIVRDRSRVILCEGCLRITVGTPEENEKLVSAMLRFS